MSKYFFFLGPIGNILFGALWWVFLMLIILFIPFTRVWWWVVFPILLSIELRTLYLWWISWDVEYANTKWVILEIIPPKEILTPLKAMEDVFAVMYGPLIDGANFRELWCDGELGEAPYWMSCEIVSVEGSIHFYARLMSAHRNYFESTLYSHYPELEIKEVPDYTKNVPQSIPNAEYEMYGEDFKLTGPAPYPIKTFENFFEPDGEKISAEEKRIDPINSLLESMSRLGPGEQYWVQYIITSCGPNEGEPAFKAEAKKIIGKIAGRPEKKVSTFGQEISTLLTNVVAGPQKEGSGEKASYSWRESQIDSESGERELLLTPGERATLTDVEEKLKKPLFRASIRGIYLAKRENFKSASGKLMRTYVGHFSTGSTLLKFDGNTRTKVHYVFRKSRVFIRARKMFRNYVSRFPAYFPDRLREVPFLSSEELATLFHFPFKISSLAFPTVERVEHRKGGPPSNLPIE